MNLFTLLKAAVSYEDETVFFNSPVQCSTTGGKLDDVLGTAVKHRAVSATLLL